MNALDRTRGVLVTPTVIVLPGFSDWSSSWLSRLMTTVTLAELSVGPLLVVARTDQERAARQAPCNGPKLISTRSRATLLQPKHSDKSPPRCGEMVARSPLAL